MKIYYFTRTNNSKEVAYLLADKISADVYQITDDKNWQGILNYIKAGASASKKSDSNITYHAYDAEEELYLVFPIWAGTLPPAIRKFVSEAKNNKINAIVLSMKSSLKDKDKELFYKTYEVKGKKMYLPSELL